MGEVSEMMLDGTLCEWCGVYIGESLGFPELCTSCREEVEGEQSNERS